LLDRDVRLTIRVNAQERFTVTSDLHKTIDKRFREEQITIAFPQLDVHLDQA
jgi:small-conductance mechanosensitive channel